MCLLCAVEAMSQPTIAPVPEPQWREALAMVFSHLEPGQQRRQLEGILSAANQQPQTLACLLGAWRGERLVGAALAQVQAGRTAMVWPPGLAPGESPPTADGLLAAICDWLSSQGVRLAQSLLGDAATAQHDILERHGFRHLADLLYLVSGTEEAVSVSPGCALRFVEYNPQFAGRLAAVVKQTYQDTLDCPALNGVQAIEDVLAGYRAAGVFRPQWWLIVQHERRDVGCLLLADHPQQGNVELVYMGLVPHARGRGWGLQIVRHAQWLARLAGRQHLVAAVDAANQPALHVYALAGFDVWERRAAFVRIFPL